MSTVSVEGMLLRVGQLEKEKGGTGYTPSILFKPSNQVLAGSQKFPSVISGLRDTSMQINGAAPSSQPLCGGNFVLDSVRVAMGASHVVCLLRLRFASQSQRLKT